MNLSTRSKTRLPAPPWSGIAKWLLSGLGMALSLSVSATTLQQINYSALPGNKVQIRLKLDGKVGTPRVFVTDQPARLVVDLFGVHSQLPRTPQNIGIGLAHSVSAIETPDRTRVVVSLADATAYTMQTEDQSIVLQLDAGAAIKINEKDQAKTFAKSGDSSVTGIDFTRGSSGEGRVVVRLNQANLKINVTEQAGKVIAEFLDVTLPDTLNRKLSVTDFATPVTQITSQTVGKDVRMTMEVAGEYEFMSYQMNEVFTAEFRPLTKDEKAKKQETKKTFTGDRLSLNFQNIEVRAILQLLADFTGLNMVISDTVIGNVTLRLQNVPWDQAMDIILKSKGLAMRQTGNVVMVAPTEEVAQREKLELESKKQVEELAPLRSSFFQVNYAKAQDIANLLKTTDNRLLSERGQVSVDARTNTLLIQDTANKLEEIQAIVARLDIAVRQVLIESRVVIANHDFAKELGVRLGLSRSNTFGSHELLIAGQQSGYNAGTYNIDKGPFSSDTAGNAFNSGLTIEGKSAAASGAEALMVNLPAAAANSGVNFLLGKVGSYLLQLELSAMQSEGQGEIISSPRVVTSDQNKAVIKQGYEIPYQEAAASGATTVAFKEVVLQLEVTPHITPDDRIRMELQVNKDNPDFSRQVLGVPPLETRQVKTTVLVDNGETVVLGGVFERTKQTATDKVPLFGDIPYVGALFRHNNDIDQNKELLIFVTPKILKDALGVK